MFTKFARPSRTELAFEVHGMDLSMVNSIRRTILADLDHVGFYFDVNDHGEDKHIRVLTNTSSLHNEFLAHRISMLPIHFPEDGIESYRFLDYTYKLYKKNTTAGMLDVTTEDFQIYDAENNLMPDEFRKRLFPPFVIHDPDKKAKREFYPIIVRLKPNRHDPSDGPEVRVEAHASVGKSCHPCYGGHSLCSYGYKGKGGDETDPVSGVYEVAIESECAMLPETFWVRGISVLKHRMERIWKSIEERDFEIREEQPKLFTLLCKDENDTAGNLIQSLFYRQFMAKDASDKERPLSYVGYFCPHPQEAMCLVKVRFVDERISEEEVRGFFVRGVKWIIDQLESTKSSFVRELGQKAS